MAKDKMADFLETDSSAANSALAKKLNVIADDIQAKENDLKTQQAKKTVQKQVNFRITEAEYDEYSRFFGGNGVSMSAGLRMCVDYIFRQAEMGNLVLAKSGIWKKELRSL